MSQHVYILELSNKKHYVGCTSNMEKRLIRHNEGMVESTKNHLPAKLAWHCTFPNRQRAFAFEKYLKSGSGRAFASKHLID